MERKISATNARVHFGELLRGVSEERATYLVERSGAAVAVVIPIEEYERLTQPQEEYRRPKWLENALRISEDLGAERTENATIDWTQMINEGRKERDEALLDVLLRRESGSDAA